MLKIVQAALAGFKNDYQPFLKAVQIPNGSISVQLQFNDIKAAGKEFPNAEQKSRCMLGLIDHIRETNPGVEVSYRDSYKNAKGDFVAGNTVYVNTPAATQTSVEEAVKAAFAAMGITTKEDMAALLAAKQAKEAETVVDEQIPAT